MAFLLRLNHEFMEILKLIESKLFLEGDRFASMKYWSDWKDAINTEQLLWRSIKEIPFYPYYQSVLLLAMIFNWFGILNVIAIFFLP